MLIGYKLLRRRKDGSLGPLFINRQQRIPLRFWLEAECVPTKGFAVRPGWHVCSRQLAPHLTSGAIAAERVWARVEMGGVIVEHHRPKAQGGLWYTASSMRVLEILGPAANVASGEPLGGAPLSR